MSAKNIVNDDDNTKVIKQKKEDINASQIETSQKKSVSKKSAIKTMLENNPDENNDDVVHYRDYSGRIKYDSLDGNNSVSQSDDIIKSDDSSDAFKTDTVSDDLVKSDAQEGSFKSNDFKFDTTPKSPTYERQESSVPSFTSSGIKKAVKQQQKETVIGQRKTAYVKNTDNSVNGAVKNNISDIVKSDVPILPLDERQESSTPSFTSSGNKKAVKQYQRETVVGQRKTAYVKNTDNSVSGAVKNNIPNIVKSDVPILPLDERQESSTPSFTSSGIKKAVKQQQKEIVAGQRKIAYVKDTDSSVNGYAKDNISDIAKSNTPTFSSDKGQENSSHALQKPPRIKDIIRQQQVSAILSRRNVNIKDTNELSKTAVKDNTRYTIKPLAASGKTFSTKENKYNILPFDIRVFKAVVKQQQIKNVMRQKESRNDSVFIPENNISNSVKSDIPILPSDERQESSTLSFTSSGNKKAVKQYQRETVVKQKETVNVKYTDNSVNGIVKDNISDIVKNDALPSTEDPTNSIPSYMINLTARQENTPADNFQGDIPIVSEEEYSAENIQTQPYYQHSKPQYYSTAAKSYMINEVKKDKKDSKTSKSKKSAQVEQNKASNAEKKDVINNNTINAVRYIKDCINPDKPDEYGNAENKAKRIAANAAADTYFVFRRKRVINKANIERAVKNLGIKSPSANKDMLKAAVLPQNNIASAIAQVGGVSVKRGLLNTISEKSEDGYAFKVIDTGIKAADTVQGAKMLVTTSANTVKKAAKMPKKVYKNTKKGINVFKLAIKKAKNHTLKDAVKKYTVKTAKRIAVAVVNAIVTSMLSLVSAFVPLMLIIIIAGGVIAAVCSVIWQTSDDLDTTQIVKYISELDYNQQREWFSKGKTNVSIEQSNERGHVTNSYYYILAYDMPLDTEPPDGSIPSDGNINCLVTAGIYTDGDDMPINYHGFNKICNSSDELLEIYRWTTDDYRSALAYLQVKNDNLGWLSTLFGFVGEMQLKADAKELHEATYKQNVVCKFTDHSDDTTTYTYEEPIFSVTYRSRYTRKYYYFGRKQSVNYLIENDIIRFSDDDDENTKLKEQYRYVCKYGNLAVGNLIFPLELGSDEKISDRIAKHFGKQLVLKYTPPEHDDDDDYVYGSVSGISGYHYANDLIADEGDNIYSPINGLCKVSHTSDRGYEFTISTSHNGSSFDYSKEGYVVKISCAKTSNIPVGSYVLVRKGDLLGTVAESVTVNYEKPDDIFADKLYPCSTGTGYHYLGSNEFDEPDPEYSHIHMEMYQLPCNFSDEADIEKNILAPELFFDYSNEID